MHVISGHPFRVLPRLPMGHKELLSIKNRNGCHFEDSMILGSFKVLKFCAEYFNLAADNGLHPARYGQDCSKVRTRDVHTEQAASFPVIFSRQRVTAGAGRDPGVDRVTTSHVCAWPRCQRKVHLPARQV